MTKMKTQSLVSSPGELLQKALRDKGMTNVQLAELLGRSPQYVTDIIKGKKAMDVDLAIQLEQALDGYLRAQAWMESAISYHRASAKVTRLDVLAKHDYAKQLVKLKWIDGNLPLEELDQKLTGFWAVEAEGKVAVDYKGSAGARAIVDEVAKRAWTIEVYRRAMAKPCPSYDESKFPQLIADLQKLMADEGKVAEVQATIERYGIRVVILPNPEKCPVDGVASYNHAYPYIGLSMRIARLDSFWFVVLHELMHVKNKDSKPADTIDRIPANDKKEQAANELARNAIISDGEYEAFVRRGVFTFSAISEAAASGHHPIHPSMLLGRLKNDLILDWSQFAREHPGVRELVLNASR